MEWKKIGGLWNPENQKEIKGKLVNVENDLEVNGYKYSKVYTIETQDQVMKVCGSAVLDKQMDLFKIEDNVKIIYLGKKQGKEKEYKDFEVYFGRDIRDFSK